MTEAERIKTSTSNKIYADAMVQLEKLTAENERLQQLIKEKDEQLDYLHLKLGFSENTNKKFSDSYNEKERELKSAQELNRELVGALEAGELELRTIYERHTSYKRSTPLWLMQKVLKKYNHEQKES